MAARHGAWECKTDTSLKATKSGRDVHIAHLIINPIQAIDY